MAATQSSYFVLSLFITDDFRKFFFFFAKGFDVIFNISIKYCDPMFRNTWSVVKNVWLFLQVSVYWRSKGEVYKVLIYIYIQLSNFLLQYMLLFYSVVTCNLNCRLDDIDSTMSMPSGTGGKKKYRFCLDGLFRGRGKKKSSKSFKVGMKRGSDGLLTLGRSLRTGVTRAVFPEDLKVSDKMIFDPQDRSLLLWNKFFVFACILAVSVDPLFFYLPVFNHKSHCIGIDEKLGIRTTTYRTIIDIFYLIRMGLQFRTAYIAPSSRVFGRGELVIDSAEIAARYLRRYFIVDFLSVLPLPQVWQTTYLTNL